MHPNPTSPPFLQIAWFSWEPKYPGGLFDINISPLVITVYNRTSGLPKGVLVIFSKLAMTTSWLKKRG